VPLSIGLLITGMLFVYFFVLPWTLALFIAFRLGVPMSGGPGSTVSCRPVWCWWAERPSCETFVPSAVRSWDCPSASGLREAPSA